jgi:phosphatidylglycerophosphatase A
VAGLVTAGIFVPGTWAAAVLAFLLFRLFDVWKPFPASVFDERVRGGLGVVGDDLIAGVYAGLVGRGILGFL